ncbi:hypothetical protein [Desulfomonile tiedjei]|uniref:hypothetical protein n=1 Tax=Desulfomonile tiedjei TaxID=2358 RepID=UPI0012F841F8|nr:hypothetical protein [Desulfomonile tiedjei]
MQIEVQFLSRKVMARKSKVAYFGVRIGFEQSLHHGQIDNPTEIDAVLILGCELIDRMN